MDDLGIAEPSRGRVIRLTYDLLGLFSFFTAGEDECRAWTLRRGCDRGRRGRRDPLGPRARASSGPRSSASTSCIEAGSMAEARKRGILRQEGKAYEVADGDVLEVLFNVGR